MGDRANVRIVSETWGSDVYLYAHWTGTELPTLVRDVLARRERWTDPSYLGRMIFSAMVKNDIDGERGYGISSCVGDGSDRIITVDTDAQTVKMPNGRKLGFAAYAGLTVARWGDE